MSVYSQVFGTDVDIDNHILTKLSGGDATNYILSCYNNIKNISDSQCKTYFNNWFNMFLSNTFMNINWRSLIEGVSKDKDGSLLNLILQTDSGQIAINNIFVHSLSLTFSQLSSLYRVIFKNTFIRDTIITSQHWMYDSGRDNQRSILGRLVNAIEFDGNWKDNIIELSNLFLLFLKSKSIKRYVVNWISQVLNQNKKRRQLNSHNETFEDCSNYKFLLNLAGVLFVLFEKGNKNGRNVSLKYLLNNDSGLEWLKDKKVEEDRYSFYEDCFFLTFRAMDLSLISIHENLDKLKFDIERLKHLIKTIGEDDEDMDHAIIEMNIIRMSVILDRKMKEVKENEMLMSNFILINWYFQFLNIFSIKLEYSLKSQDIEFDVDEVFSSIIEGSKYLLSKEYKSFDPSLMQVGIDVIGGKHTINPHIRCQFLNFIANLFSKGVMQSYMMYPSVQNNLLANSVTLYCDIETFDDVSDKFTPRANIGYIIKYTCTIDRSYYNELVSLTEDNFKFKRFINMVLNDLTYMLELGLSSLKKIKEREKKMKNTNLEDENSAEEYERECDMIKGSLSLSCDMLDLVKFFSKKEITDAFRKILLSNEIISRFIETLNFYLKKMVGKESKDLKVKDPEKYGFDPVKILLKISEVYACYFNEPEFIKFISYDEDSYDPKLMDKMISILSRKGCLNWDISGRLYSLSENAKKLFNDKEDEIEYEDIPDEFCDPILMQMIDCPIVIPGKDASHDMIVEESIIRMHLLNSDTNPFNKEKLTTQQLDEYNKTEVAINKIEDFKKRLKKWKSSYNKI